MSQHEFSKRKSFFSEEEKNRKMEKTQRKFSPNSKKERRNTDFLIF